MKTLIRDSLIGLGALFSLSQTALAQPGAALTMRPDKTGNETCEAYRRHRHEATQMVRKRVRGCAGFSEVPAAGESAASPECREIALQSILQALTHQEGGRAGSGGSGRYTLRDLERVCQNLWR